MKITASIVTFNTTQEDFFSVINSVLNTKLDITLYISDNSETNKIKDWCNNSRVVYIFNNSNRGYGAGHNVAIKEAIKAHSDYHFVINPDILFTDKTIDKMIEFMERNLTVGLAMPLIKSIDNNIQYVAKAIPTPEDIFLRGYASKLPFISCCKKIKKINYNFELRYADFTKEVSVPCISGCFMLFRMDVLKKTGLFDENFFMYFEDFDLSRRVRKNYDTVLISSTFVYHKWERGAQKNKKLRRMAIISAIKYFNKHGWFFDKMRKEVNEQNKQNKGLYISK